MNNSMCNQRERISSPDFLNSSDPLHGESALGVEKSFTPLTSLLFSSIAKHEFGESLELFVHADGCLDFSCKICSKAGCPERKNPFEKRVEWDVHNISSDEKHRVVSTP